MLTSTSRHLCAALAVALSLSLSLAPAASAAGAPDPAGDAAAMPGHAKSKPAPYQPFLALRSAVLFLIAVGERDYPKACAHMLERRGCVATLRRRGVGLGTFAVDGVLADQGHAIVQAYVDGIGIQLSLVRHEGRWLIDELGRH